MKLNKILWILLLFMLALALAACGGDGDDNGGGGGGGVNLSQTIAFESEFLGSITVNYPEGWFSATQPDQGIMIANSQAALDAMQAEESPQPEEGQVGGLITAFPSEFFSSLGIAADASPSAVLSTFVENVLTDESSEVNLGDPQEVTLNGKTAAIASGTVTEEGATSDATFVVVQAEGGVVLVIFRASEGDIGEYDATIRAVAGSAVYTVPASGS